MRCIFYVLFFGSLVFANDELNSYLNNKNLQHSIIKDEKSQRIIIDLLDIKNKMIIFNKGNNKDYRKVFDEKVYFVQDFSKMSFQNIAIEEEYVLISSTITNVAPSINFTIKFYFNIIKNYELTKITKLYYNIEEDVITEEYEYTPVGDILNLYNFKSKNFVVEYLDKNYKNFIKIGNPKPLSKNTNEQQSIPKEEKSFFSKLLEWFGFSKLNENMSFMYS